MIHLDTVSHLLPQNRVWPTALSRPLLLGSCAREAPRGAAPPPSSQTLVTRPGDIDLIVYLDETSWPPSTECDRVATKLILERRSRLRR
jgi:hypothetical protein